MFTVMYLFSVLTFLILSSELFLRVLYPQQLYPALYIEDSNVVYKYKPNIKGFVQTEEFFYTVKTNSMGLRDEEFPVEKSKDVYRVLVLGDSFTYGTGVELDETYLKLLESKFNGKKGKRYQFINFGVGGYGTVHQLSSYIDYGKQLKPDLVILSFNNTDFGNNISSPLRCEDEEGSVQCRMLWDTKVEKVRKMTRLIPFYPYLAQHSHLLNLFRGRLMGYMATVQEEEHKEHTQSDVLVRKSVEITEKYVLSFSRLVESEGSRFIFVLMPIFDDYVFEETSDKSQGRIAGINKRWHYKVMKRICKHQKDKCINLIDYYAELKISYDNLFFKNDGHFNISGHQHVANAIYKHLQI